MLFTSGLCAWSGEETGDCGWGGNATGSSSAHITTSQPVPQGKTMPKYVFLGHSKQTCKESVE